MKKLLLLTIALPFGLSAFSQISKGNFLIGGSAGFNSQKTAGSAAASAKESVFTFSPDAGFFFINNAAAGIRVGLSGSNSTVGGSEYTTKYTNLSLSPFVRYYFLPQKNKVNVFADASYNYNSVKTKYGSSYSTAKYNGFTVIAGPSVFLNQHVAMEFTVGYNSFKAKGADSKVNTFESNIGFQIHLGKIKV